MLEGVNVLVCINGRKNKLRVYYLSWLRNKILKGDDVRGEEREGGKREREGERGREEREREGERGESVTG